MIVRRSWSILAILPAIAGALHGGIALYGDLEAHDPSTIIRFKDRYWMFFTGRGCLSKSSPDLVEWRDGPAVFPTALPSWVAGAAPGNNGDIWAPDIIFLNGRFSLYYSVSSWGSNRSAIALATNPTLDPADSSYHWTDQGIVIQSVAQSDFNTIDPCVFKDSNGSLWLTFGSYWSGIKLIQLNAATGKRIAPDSPIRALAWNSSIEASCLYKHGGLYYLFVNWDTCCQGLTSGYNIRVGRSASITGPFLDRAGIDLLDGGGTLFREGSGLYIGPGHMGITSVDGVEWFSNHYYNANLNGAPKLDVEPLEWDAGGWPAFSSNWRAVYGFEGDARDQMDQFDGALLGGAAIVQDPQRGQVLDLAGGNRYLRLPPGAARARTFAAWVKWNGGGAWQRIFDFGVDTTRYLFLTPKAASGRLHFGITSSGAGGEQWVEAPAALPVGVWTHVAVTLDAAGGVLYMNGAQAARNAAMNISPASLLPDNVWLGKSEFVADPYFSGRLDSVKIFGRALSASEVLRLASAAAPDQRLLARYRFDEKSGDVARDSTSNLNDATVTGRPVWDDGALVLNGVTDFLQTPVPNGPERTLAAWIRPLGSEDVAYIESVFDSDVSGQHGSGFGLDGGFFKVILDDQFWEPRVPVALDRWTHVALAFDRTTARLYVDGAPAASLAYTQGAVSQASYTIGKSHANPLFFHGAIADARIYAVALAAPEIRAIYQEGLDRRQFVRGDANADGKVDISDGIAVLGFLFQGAGSPPCESAADSNADSSLDVSDGVYLLSFLFTAGPPPKAPFPGCGQPAAAGSLGCSLFPWCP
jgi:arabinan endo-1,5-alpha-L-arabinosidase